jgi:Alr-MurF fusion protein
MFSFRQIADLSGAHVFSNHAVDVDIKHALTDSRALHFPQETLFVAIKGKNHDAHHYIESLFSRGVRHFVVEDETHVSDQVKKGSNILKVTSSLRFLQTMAGFKRRMFQIPVLAITGSNAKTIVKEWLWQLLQHDYSIVRSPKSYNSQLGVPLSVWEMEAYHTLGIFEAGISLPGEMEHLQAVIAPTHGIFTNIGTAHDEGFVSREQKIQEKLKLFKGVEHLIYCKDHQAIHHEVEAQGINAFVWSRKDREAHVFIAAERQVEQGWQMDVVFEGQTMTITVPFADEASIENAIHAMAFLLLMGYSADALSKRMGRLEPVKMRLELKNGTNGCVLVDDSYNNDLMGLTLALDFAQQHRRELPLTIILSDVLESGMPPKVLYTTIAELLQTKRVSHVIGIGPLISSFKYEFPKESIFYLDTASFLKQFDFSSLTTQLVLVKGARAFGFEEITKRLEAKVHGTRFEVDLDALVHNLNYYRAVAKPGTLFMAMVKAFAYGSGSHEVAQLLQHHGINYLAVAYTDEGVDLRNHGITVPIMVLNPDKDSFRNLLRYKLEPEIYSFKLLHEFIAFLTWEEASSRVQLKIDTGMRRLGFDQKDVSSLLDILHKHSDRIHVSGMFTHLAAADEAQWDGFTETQLKTFQSISSDIETSLGYSTIKHALNSAGIVRFPQYSFDMVRLGIGLYGIEANALFQDQLQTVGRLKTHISQIKHVEPGETVGYSRKGKVTQPTQIATIAIGYADGFDRRFSNGVGKVNVNGTLCPVIGNVCMDMTMIDITGVTAQEGDEVIVFGENPTIIAQAKAIGTISYELLTSVGERVKRIFFKN